PGRHVEEVGIRLLPAEAADRPDQPHAGRDAGRALGRRHPILDADAVRDDEQLARLGPLLVEHEASHRVRVADDAVGDRVRETGCVALARTWVAVEAALAGDADG